MWNANIPPQSYGTYVNYTIFAEDNAGNTVSSQELFGYHFQYHVIPESPFIAFPLLLIIATLLIAIAFRKKRSSTL
jgi:hypothetical protein